MEKYKSITRTTIEKMDDLPHVGIYIIAYLGKVIYIGRARESVIGRLKAHMVTCTPIGAWIRRVNDWYNVRLDILEAPDCADVDRWLDTAETALIHRFTPLLNVALMG